MTVVCMKCRLQHQSLLLWVSRLSQAPPAPYMGPACSWGRPPAGGLSPGLALLCPAGGPAMRMQMLSRSLSLSGLVAVQQMRCRLAGRLPHAAEGAQCLRLSAGLHPVFSACMLHAKKFAKQHEINHKCFEFICESFALLIVFDAVCLHASHSSCLTVS